MLKRTPLWAAHQRLGGRLIEFGGWEMPVQYTGIVDEHLAVRRAAGLFDIAHMGEVEGAGAGALEFLNRMVTNDVRRLAVGQAQYALLCNERGGVVDDLYVYRTGESDYLLIVNASRVEVDFAWLQRACPADGTVALRNRSGELGALALQGPRSPECLAAVLPGASTGGTAVEGVAGLRKNEIGQFGWMGRPVWVARTGYTGEDGFELVASSELLDSLWEGLLGHGRAQGLKPCGLGARDTLRTEVCYPLYGHELDENTTPLEAGLGFFVALEKGEFVGRGSLMAQKAAGVTRRCVALRMAEKSPPPRPQYPVWSTGEGAGPVGVVVSGTQSPSLSVGIGLAYVPVAQAKVGTGLGVEVRGRRFGAEVVAKPFYRKG